MSLHAEQLTIICHILIDCDSWPSDLINLLVNCSFLMFQVNRLLWAEAKHVFSGCSDELYTQPVLQI